MTEGYKGLSNNLDRWKQGRREGSFAGRRLMAAICRQRAWSLGVGSRDYPYFQIHRKMEVWGFICRQKLFLGGSHPHNPPCDGPGWTCKNTCKFQAVNECYQSVSLRSLDVIRFVLYDKFVLSSMKKIREHCLPLPELRSSIRKKLWKTVTRAYYVP